MTDADAHTTTTDTGAGTVPAVWRGCRRCIFCFFLPPRLRLQDGSGTMGEDGVGWLRAAAPGDGWNSALDLKENLRKLAKPSTSRPAICQVLQ
jgi:hypothetical protein